MEESKVVEDEESLWKDPLLGVVDPFYSMSLLPSWEAPLEEEEEAVGAVENPWKGLLLWNRLVCKELDLRYLQVVVERSVADEESLEKDLFLEVLFCTRSAALVHLAGLV